MAIVLNPIVNPEKLSLINSNFTKIAAAINESLVWRNGNTAGETSFTRDLDMNGYQILNAYVGDYSLSDVVEIANGAGEAAQSAQESAERAEDAADKAESASSAIISVKSFGAIGDGVADDTEAIQAALNSNHTNIYFPEGRYKISDNTMNGTPTLESTIGDRTLSGPGIITAGNWVYTALHVTGPRTKVHLNIDGNSYIGVALDIAADECEVSGCNIRNLYQPANQWTTIGIRAQFGMNDWSVVVRDNIFDNFEAVGDGIGGNGTGMSRAVLLSATNNVTKLSLVTGNKISSIIGEEGDAIVAVSLNAGVYLNFPVLISNNTVTTWSRRAVKIQANKATIRGNVFRNTYSSNPGGMQHAVSLVQGGDHVVDSNTFIDCKYASQVGLLAGGTTERVDNICVTNNVILGLGAETLFGAIGVTSYGENVVVCNNHILCPDLGASSAISVTNALSGLVSGNNIFVNSASHYNFTGSANLYKSSLSNKANTPGVNTSSANNDAFSVNVFGATNRALTLYNWDNVLSDAEIISRIQFHQNDDSSPNTVQASIRCVAVGTAGAAALTFHTGGGAQTSDAERLRISIGGNIEPGADGTQNLGSATKRYATVFASTGAINTSDRREKSESLNITDEILDAWGDVQFISFQWLSAIQQKGEDVARWHFGVIAQQVRDAFEARGIDGTRYGLLCYDEWDDVYAPAYATRIVEREEDGQVIAEEEQYETGEEILIKSAGNRWGIRPDQCLFLEAAYQRRNYERLLKRIEILEGNING